MSEFDDLIPEKAPEGSGAFDDLVPAGAFDDLVPAKEEVGTLRGIAGTARLAFKGTGQAIDAARLAELPRGATMRQERRAFEKSMGDVRFTDPLAAPDVRELVGPGRRVEEMRLPVEMQRRELAEKIAVRERELRAIEQAPAMERWNLAKGRDAVKVFVRDPVEITSNIIVQGLAGSLPAVGGAVAGSAAGPGGTAAGAGLGSLAVEYSNKLLSSMREAGVDLADADAVDRAFRDPRQLAAMKQTAVDRGIPVAAFDAFSAGIAGKFLGGATGTRQVVRAGATEAGVQAASGAAGELAGELAAGEKISGKEIFAEAIGELGPGAVETALNASRAARSRTTPAAALVPRVTEFQAPEPATLEEALQEVDKTVVEVSDPMGLNATAEPETATELQDRRMFPVVEVPISELRLSADVPNFKAEADPETGVVAGQRLEGKYERLGTGAITVWERNDGRREVISGRHRFDLARRAGERTIPSQIVREADGFTKEMVMTLDAEMNIRDGQGSVGDYANYFRNTAIDEEAARARGLLSRAKGKAGWALGKAASDDLYALYRAGKVSEAQAVAIATAAPNEAALQRVGSRATIKGAGPQELANFIQAVRYKTRNAPAEQLDLFGADDAAMNEAERLGQIATQLQRELDKEIKATDNAVRNAELAKAKGLRFERDPDVILSENAQMRVLRKSWDNWALHPELVGQVLAKAGVPAPGPRLEVAQMPGLTPEKRAVEAEATRMVQERAEEMIAEYERRFGNTLDVDDARELFPAYTKDLESRGTMVQAVHEPASALVLEMYRRKLAQKGGSDNVMFLAGGAGSGKSTALQNFRPGEKLLLQFDSVMANFSSAVKRIEQALAAGRKVQVMFVYSPFEQATAQMINRAQAKGRTVPAEVHAQGHFEAPRVLLQLAEKYEGDPRVRIRVIDSTGPAGNARIVGIDFLADKLQSDIGRLVDEVHRQVKERESQLRPAVVRGIIGDPEGGRSGGQTGERAGGQPESRGEEGSQSVEDFLDSLKVDTAGQLHAFGLVPATWNLLIDLVKVGVRAGRTVADAIEWAIAQIKERFPGQEFDEAGARAELLSLADRQFTQKVLDPESEVSGQVRTWITPAARFYEPRSNQTDAEAANAIIDGHGIDNAIVIFKDVENALPGAVRTALGLALIKRLGMEEQAATLRGDRVAAEAAIGKQVDLVESVTTRATEIAQSLQAMSMWARMTPAGHLKAARRVFEQAAGKALARLRPALESIKGVLENVNEGTAVDVVKSPEVVRAVDQVAGEAVAKAAHNQIVIEVAGALGSSPAVVELIRQQTRKSIGAQQLRQVANLLQTILARHYVDPEGKTLASKIRGAGLEQETAESLAAKIDAEFTRAVQKREAAVKTKVRMAREAKALGLRSTESELDRAIQRELKRLDVRLGTIVRWHYAKADELGQSLAKRLSEGLGLSEDGAGFLAARIEGRFKQLATERKAAELAKLPGSVRSATVQRPAFQQKLIEASNLGALSEEHFYNTVKEQLGLPVFTPAIAAEITRQANALQKLPAGFQQQRAQAAMMNYIARQKGVRWHELALPFWFANVLSGPTTHLVNMVANTFNLAAHAGLEIVKRPGATLGILQGLGRGAGKGILEGADVLRSGQQAQSQKHRPGRLLEAAEFKGWAYPLRAWRYVWRAMAAEDLLFLKAAQEMRQAVAARVIAKEEGISDRNALKLRVAELLGNTVAARTAAEAQAHGEGLKGLDFRRRVNEIIEQGRPASMQSALEYAAKVTFNNEPYGVLGSIARGVQSIVNEQPALRLIVPFINIIANVTNESLNYLPPVGYARALYGSWSGKLDGREMANRDELIDQYAKATVGLLALAGVAALAVKYGEDDDPFFAVTGAGPRTADQRNQLKETGWIPYSFKIGGRYQSYTQTPMAIPMAILGNYMDARKYKRLDETDALNRVAYATFLSGRVITEQSFLNGVADLFETLSRDSTKRAGESGTRSAARIGAGFVVPNLLRQVDQIFDPTVYEADTVQAALANQVPFARRLNRPTLNALGEPVEKYVSSRFTSEQRPDELWRLLTTKQAWVPVVDRETIVGDRKRGEDYFRMLLPEEVYELTRESGALIRDRLEANIDLIYGMEPEEAKAFVQRIVEQERARVKQQMR